MYPPLHTCEEEPGNECMRSSISVGVSMYSIYTAVCCHGSQERMCGGLEGKAVRDDPD